MAPNPLSSHTFITGNPFNITLFFSLMQFNKHENQIPIVSVFTSDG